MKDNEEKQLIEFNKKSIFFKVKRLFINLFKKKERDSVVENRIRNVVSNDRKKDNFMNSVKKVEDEETKLLKLQKQYRNGEIKEEDMTSKQVKALCDLYDKQIAELEKSNAMRKQKLLEYRKNMKTA